MATKPKAKRTPTKPKWTKADQASLAAWEKAHPFPGSTGTATHPVKPKPRRFPGTPRGGGGHGGGGGGSGHRLRIQPGGRIKGKGKGPSGPRRFPGTPRGASAPLGMMVSEYGWVRGLNEEYPTCVATAIANSLLTVRGIRATDDQVMRLHYHAGAGSGNGVSIADALGSVMDCGLAGVRPVAYFAINRDPGFGSILGMTDGENDHAVTLTSSGLIAWGAPLPEEMADAWMLDGEAWHVQW